MFKKKWLPALIESNKLQIVFYAVCFSLFCFFKHFHPINPPRFRCSTGCIQLLWEITIIALRLIGPVFYLVSAELNLQPLDWELVVFCSSADVFLLASDVQPRHFRALQILMLTLKELGQQQGSHVRVRVRSLCSDMQKKSIFCTTAAGKKTNLHMHQQLDCIQLCSPHLKIIALLNKNHK